jgi:hypothetical protein
VADIYRRDLEEKAKNYISKLPAEDREDMRGFYTDLTARGYSPSRVDKYMASLVSIGRRLGSFKKARREDVKRYVACPERSGR